MGTLGTALAQARDYLADARNRPGQLLIVHACCYGILQAVAWAYLGAALPQHPVAIAAFCVNVALPPFFIWTTYNSVRTAWQRQPPDEIKDGAIPFVVVGCAACLLWLGIR